jgi:hypothetical protein
MFRGTEHSIFYVKADNICRNDTFRVKRKFCDDSEGVNLNFLNSWYADILSSELWIKGYKQGNLSAGNDSAHMKLAE